MIIAEATTPQADGEKLDVGYVKTFQPTTEVSVDSGPPRLLSGGDPPSYSKESRRPSVGYSGHASKSASTSLEATAFASNSVLKGDH